MFLTLITFELDVDWIGNTEWNDVYISRHIQNHMNKCNKSIAKVIFLFWDHSIFLHIKKQVELSVSDIFYFNTYWNLH